MGKNFPAMQLDTNAGSTDSVCIGCGGTGMLACEACGGDGVAKIRSGSAEFDLDEQGDPQMCTCCGGTGEDTQCPNCFPEDDTWDDDWLEEPWSAE